MDRRKVAEHLGKNIRAKRKELGLSQQRLAKLSGLHLNWIGALERGSGNATVPALIAIAGALGCEPQALLGELAPQSAGEPAPIKASSRLQNDIRRVLQDRAQAGLLARFVALLLLVPQREKRKRRRR